MAYIKYVWTTDMGIVEFAIVKAIEDLNQTGQLFGQQDIANHIQCHILTVQRGCSALKKKGQLRIEGHSKTGFRYILYETVNA